MAGSTWPAEPRGESPGRRVFRGPGLLTLPACGRPRKLAEIELLVVSQGEKTLVGFISVQKIPNSNVAVQRLGTQLGVMATHLSTLQSISTSASWSRLDKALSLMYI
jgi:hypothetical protein